jgi:hypothetical protein
MKKVPPLKKDATRSAYKREMSKDERWQEKKKPVRLRLQLLSQRS